jgi:hypothetical protein
VIAVRDVVVHLGAGTYVEARSGSPIAVASDDIGRLVAEGRWPMVEPDEQLAGRVGQRSNHLAWARLAGLIENTLVSGSRRPAGRSGQGSNLTNPVPWT